MLQDRVTAVELLRKAWEIDPNSRETGRAFRNRGFRKAKDRVGRGGRAARNPAAGAGTNPARPAAATTQSLLGLTPEELRVRN